jgi:hypothetical protein
MTPRIVFPAIVVEPGDISDAVLFLGSNMSR